MLDNRYNLRQIYRAPRFYWDAHDYAIKAIPIQVGAMVEGRAAWSSCAPMQMLSCLPASTTLISRLTWWFSMLVKSSSATEEIVVVSEHAAQS